MSNPDPRIAPKEMIVTRFKSAQQKMQLREKDRSMTKITDLLKSPPNKTIKTKKRIKKASPNAKKVLQVSGNDEHTEYYPHKLRRKFEETRVFLRPKYESTTIVKLNKRKLGTPRRGFYLEGKNSPTASQDYQHLPQDYRPKHRPLSPVFAELSMEEVVRLVEETDGLDDEDFMEILTCPSPVWWEDPPGDEYIEEAIFKRKEAEPTKPKRARKDKCQETNNIPIVKEIPPDITGDIEINNKDDRFLKKRSKLENLLGNIKNKTLITKDANEIVKPNVTEKDTVKEAHDDDIPKTTVKNKTLKTKDANEIVKPDLTEKDTVKEAHKDDIPKTTVKNKTLKTKDANEIVKPNVTEKDTIKEAHKNDIPKTTVINKTLKTKDANEIVKPDVTEKDTVKKTHKDDIPKTTGKNKTLKTKDANEIVKPDVTEKDNVKETHKDDIPKTTVINKTLKTKDANEIIKPYVTEKDTVKETHKDDIPKTTDKNKTLNTKDANEIVKPNVTEKDTVKETYKDDIPKPTVSPVKAVQEKNNSESNESLPDLSFDDEDLLMEFENIDIPIEATTEMENKINLVVQEQGVDNLNNEIPMVLPPLVRRPQIENTEAIETDASSSPVRENIDTISDTNIKFISDEDDNTHNVKQDIKIDHPNTNSDILKAIDKQDFITVYKIVQNDQREKSFADKLKNIPEYSSYVEKLTKQEAVEDCAKYDGQLNSFFKKCKNVNRKKKTDKLIPDSDSQLCGTCEPKKSTIDIAQEENVKYCLNCSSIFDTEECSYCINSKPDKDTEIAENLT